MEYISDLIDEKIQGYLQCHLSGVNVILINPTMCEKLLSEIPIANQMEYSELTILKYRGIVIRRTSDLEENEIEVY